MTELVQQGFDYSLIDERDRDFLIGKEQSIKQRTAQTVIENGRDLLEAKARVGHGKFLKWVEGCFPWSQQTANNMMNVAENFKFQTVGNLENFQARALYALASPSVPETARQEAISIAESGEKVTNEKAKELIEAHKRIGILERQLAEAKSQIPTDDIQAKISILEKQLADEQNKPAVKEIVEVEPDDYKEAIETKERLIDEKSRLLNQIKNLKESQQAEVDKQVNDKLKALDDEFKTKNIQLKTVQDRIDVLRDSIKKMDKTAGDLFACKEACNGIRNHLIEMSIKLRDLFEDHEVNDAYINELKKLCSEMEQGVMAFRGYIYNDKFIGES